MEAKLDNKVEVELKYKPKKKNNELIYIILTILSIAFLAPIFIVLYNSFKGKLYISRAPFALPNKVTFLGLQNYIGGVEKTGFLAAFGYSVFITVCSTAVIVLFTSMTAWYITRIKSKFTSALYYLFVLSMIVPFQMVMFPMSKVANILSLDNPIGIIVIYLGFGSGLSVFMFSGFVKSIPIDIEEAAMIDGCSRFGCFVRIIVPLARAGVATQVIFNGLTIWNDYFMANIMITKDELRTLPLSIANFVGKHSTNYPELFAMLTMATIPVIIVFVLSQKSFIEGVAAGAVKG